MYMLFVMNGFTFVYDSLYHIVTWQLKDRDSGIRRDDHCVVMAR